MPSLAVRPNGLLYPTFPVGEPVISGWAETRVWRLREPLSFTRTPKPLRLLLTDTFHVESQRRSLAT